MSVRAKRATDVRPIPNSRAIVAGLAPASRAACASRSCPTVNADSTRGGVRRPRVRRSEAGFALPPAFGAFTVRARRTDSRSTASRTIENRHVVPLTASFEKVPAEHDRTTFVFHVRFSEDPAVSYLVLRDESFGVTGGEVVSARRKDGRDDLREIHVEPSGYGDVTVSLAPTTDCDARGAICTVDDRPLSSSLTTTVAGPAGLSVSDARATEGSGASVDFAVSLSRSASGSVTVDYATRDVTATAGADYTAMSSTLTFEPGERSGTVSVPVLDDTHDDAGETFTLALSNPSGAYLSVCSATAWAP